MKVGTASSPNDSAVMPRSYSFPGRSADSGATTRANASAISWAITISCDGDREPLADGVADRLARAERTAEVAGHGVAEPLHVAHGNGLVEVEHLPRLLDLLGRDVERVAADERQRRVAGEQLVHDRGEERDDEEGDDEPDEPAEDERSHVGSAVEGVDLGEFVVGEVEVVERREVRLELLDAGRAGDHARHLGAVQDPRQRHLRQRLVTAAGDGVEPARGSSGARSTEWPRTHRPGQSIPRASAGTSPSR